MGSRTRLLDPLILKQPQLTYRPTLQRNATLVTIFANYLFIDTILSTLPRLVAFTLFPALRSQLCSVDSIHAWLQSQATPNDLLSSEPGLIAQEMVGQCQDVVIVLQILLGVVGIGSTIVQTLLAMRVSRFASALRNEESVQATAEMARFVEGPAADLKDEKQVVYSEKELSQV